MKSKNKIGITLLLLVCFAFYTPYFVFQIQDKRQLQKVQKIERNAPEYNLLTKAYEADGYKRLKAFAKGLEAGDRYYVMEADNDRSVEEIYTLLQENKVTETPVMQTIANFAGFGIGQFDAFVQGISIDDYTSYVIYNDKKGEIAFCICCIELSAYQASKLRILVDEKDGTVYHAEIIGDDTKVYMRYESYEKIRTECMAQISSAYWADSETYYNPGDRLCYEDSPLNFQFYVNVEMDKEDIVAVSNARIGFEALYNMISYEKIADTR